LPGFISCGQVVEISQNNPFSCTIDFPDDTDFIRAQIRYLRTGGSSFASQRFITRTLTRPNCTLVEQTPAIPEVPAIPAVPGFADWIVSYDPADQSQILALECEDDEGVHGASSGSNEVFPQRQESTNTSFQPNYTSNAGDPNALNWDAPEFPVRYLYPGNYHDYLQTPDETFLGGATIVNLPSGNTPLTYCRNNADDFVRDPSTNNVFFCESRVAAMKDSMDNIVSALSGVNVGVARFNRRVGGSIIEAVSDIDVGTKRQDVIATVRALTAQGSTPLQETLNEGRRYYHGLELRDSIKTADKRVAVDPNTTDDIPAWVQINDDITDPSAIDANDNYISPIISECQDNNIILLSDGSASRDTGDVAEIRAFSGLTCASSTDNPTDTGNANSVDNGACLPAVATGLANVDARPNIPNTNTVNLYTVAFGSDVAGSTALPAASNQGLRTGAAENSQHFTASTADQLTTTFQSIIRDLVRVNDDTFVAPAVSVSAFNRLQFEDEVYFAVFQPNDTARWNGNIKGYTIDANANLLNEDGSPAVDPDTGRFLDTARSFWSDEDDGSTASAGGFAGELDFSSTPRNLYASLNTSNTVTRLTQSNFLNMIDGAGSSVTSIGERSTGGQDVVAEKEQNRNDIVAWTFGQDVDGELGGEVTDPNFFTAESLHSSPYVLDYGSIDTNDPDLEFNSANIIYSLTNQGMVHAIDAENGSELWSYIPDADLFPNLGDYYNNVPNSPHTYGLDGEIAFDVTRDPTTLALTRANIFVGQRRGGSKYFAMNLLNGNLDAVGSPVSKLWTVSNLPRMGQSWARPIPTTINFCDDGSDSSTCNETEVLVISGGYDTRYDDAATPVADLAETVRGNAIYIVERATGELLWVAGRPNQVEPTADESYAYYTNDEMTHSFPTEPTVLDADFDGVSDLMFAVDIAGRVWRFDFRANVVVNQGGSLTFDTNDIVRNMNNNPTGSVAEVSAGIIADLSEPGVDRRFYNRLDVSITGRTENDLARYNIVTGSGYRAHPLESETAQNRIYFVFDRNTNFPQLSVDSNGDINGVSYEYVNSNTGLANNINIDELDTIGVNGLDTVSDNRHGFFVPLPNTDEKLINPTLTNSGTVLAVTYAPTEDVISNNVVCQRDIGVSFLHQISLDDGSVSTTTLASEGISAPPVVVEVPGADGRPVKVVIIGTETFETTGINPPVPLDPSKSGEVRRLNWWERVRSLVQ